MKKPVIDEKKRTADIQKKQKHLKFVAKELKKHFIGIDAQIDKIISSISVFYCCPEILTRPVIVCLLGPTGVGKTDLIRRLVKLLDYRDRFIEIEMMNKGHSAGHPYCSSISSILTKNPKIESGQPCIMLLDEIQNFRTINEDGCDLPEYKYRDIWSLLSDGKLPFEVDYEYLMQTLWDYEEAEKRKKEGKKGPKGLVARRFLRSDNHEDDDEILDDDDKDDDGIEDMLGGDLVDKGDILDEVDFEREMGGFRHYHAIKFFKSALRLTESIEEISEWSLEKKKAVIIDRMNNQNLYEESDYTKSLIFISGNLNEAYQLNDRSNDVDIDADIFHKMSSKINILDIKKALGSRFRPEQIARFGNTHVIYPTLSKNSYERIIQRKIDDIVKNIKERANIKLEIDKSINTLIYENGVFPTQGTRPVFSTISEIIEAPLATFLLKAFLKKAKVIKLSYKDNNIYASINDVTLKHPYSGAVDKLKSDKENNHDKRVLHAVHEAGHAVVYAELFGFAPPQISALTASNSIGGFIWTHDTCGSKQMIEDKICTMLAGGSAERLIFGISDSTWGLENDLQEATKLAGLMVKRLGMGDFSSYITMPQKSDYVNTDLDSANPQIEKIIKDFFVKATEIVKKNKALLKETVDFLLKHKELTPKDFKKICKKHGVSIKLRESEEAIYTNYYDQYKKF